MADKKSEPSKAKKPYRDTFGQKISQTDVSYATQLIIRHKKPTLAFLTTYMHPIGVSKAKRILKILEDANVLSKNEQGEYTIVLRTEQPAINAALRQLKKGKGTK